MWEIAMSDLVSFTLDIEKDEPDENDVQNAPTPEHCPLGINFASKSVDGKTRSTPAVYMPLFPDTQNLTKGKEQELGELKLLRRGLQVVHVFGPGKIGLECLSQLSASQAPSSAFAGTPEMGSITVQIKIFDKSFSKKYTIPINTGIYAQKQIQRQGKRSVFVREDIQFAGNTSRKVRYWYANPNPTVVRASTFVNAEGKRISVPVNVPPPPDPPDPPNPDDNQNNSNGGGGGDCPSPISQPKNKSLNQLQIKSTKHATERSTFYAKEACWGSIRVEYTVECEEFFVLFDHENPKQYAYIFEGEEPERVGYTAKKGDKEEYDYDELKDGVSATGETTDPPAKTRKFKKAEMIPLESDSFLVFAHNGQRNASASFTSTPKLVDIPISELPRLAVYELRHRTKVYPDGASSGSIYMEVDHKVKVHYVDPYGNVIEDNFAEPLETDNGSSN